MEEPFYVRRRLKDMRLMIRRTPELSHSGPEHKEMMTLLADLAKDLAEKSDNNYEATHAFILRCMGALVKARAEMVYEPYGYVNPFVNVEASAPPVPFWKWPVVNDLPGYGAERLDTESWRPYSALKRYGYTVGKTDGWPQSDREKFLSDFMEMELPPEVEQIFGNEYVSPLSAGRLRKIANLIASNASNAYRNDPVSKTVAIAHWESDLAFIKRKYYDGMGLKSQPWPSIRD